MIAKAAGLCTPFKKPTSNVRFEATCNFDYLALQISNDWSNLLCFLTNFFPVPIFLIFLSCESLVSWEMDVNEEVCQAIL